MISTSISCKQCGSTNNSGNQSCLICGADLSDCMETATPAVVSQPAQQSAIDESPIYLPYTDPSENASHPGRYFVVILFCSILGFSLWVWQRRPPPASRDSKSAVTAPVLPVAKVEAPAGDNIQPPALPSKNNAEIETQPSSVPQKGEPSRAESDVPEHPVSATSRVDALEADGEKYLYGNSVTPDCDRAQKDLLTAARHSNAKAQRVLATMYATGHCAIKDLPLAYRWFSRAQRQAPSDRIVASQLKGLWQQMSPDQRMLASR